MILDRSQVTGHQHLCQNNPTLRRLIEMRNPYIDPINIFQVLTHITCSCRITSDKA
jgi:phosphoenolpyruvate carboxylase